jgi:hemerythrin-like metal-binding protein
MSKINNKVTFIHLAIVSLAAKNIQTFMSKELIQWSQGYSVNNNEIDAQHKKLIELINLLYNVYLDQKHETEINNIIDQIKQYSLYHFKTEETLFRLKKYENTEEHIKLHQSFIDEFEAIIKTYNGLNLVITMKTMTFLQRWLTNHIIKEDKKYIGFI